MKREIPDIDFEILKECCDELNLELIPSSRSDCLTLIDKDGNSDYLDCNFNIFDEYEDVVLFEEPYLVESIYVAPKQTKTVNEYRNVFEYGESQLVVYHVEINKCVFNELNTLQEVKAA